MKSSKPYLEPGPEYHELGEGIRVFCARSAVQAEAVLGLQYDLSGGHADEVLDDFKEVFQKGGMVLLFLVHEELVPRGMSIQATCDQVGVIHWGLAAADDESEAALVPVMAVSFTPNYLEFVRDDKLAADLARAGIEPPDIGDHMYGSGKTPDKPTLH